MARYLPTPANKKGTSLATVNGKINGIIKITDNFEEVGRVQFTNLALSALEASKSNIDKH